MAIFVDNVTIGTLNKGRLAASQMSFRVFRFGGKKYGAGDINIINILKVVANRTRGDDTITLVKARSKITYFCEVRGARADIQTQLKVSLEYA